MDRPQQNGRDERKQRQLLEIAKSLRFQAKLPPQNSLLETLEKIPKYDNLKHLVVLLFQPIQKELQISSNLRDCPMYSLVILRTKKDTN